MALPNAAMPAYYSPAAASKNHSRRSSGRRSFAAIPSVAGVESPRTLCPRDGDAFSYQPQHLKEWFISQNLWNNLPATVQSSVAALQHSGAAVLTGFERLEKHGEASLAADVAAMKAEAAAAMKAEAAAAMAQSNAAGLQQFGAAAPTGVELLEKYSEAFPDDENAAMVAEATEMWKTIPAKIQSTMARLQALQHEFVDGMEGLGSTNFLKARATSDASSRRDSVYSPSFSASSSRSNSPPPSMSDSPPPAMSHPRTTSAPPSVSESQTTCPVSPMCLNPETPADEVDPIAHKRHHERRVTFPLEPHKAYYVTELTTLRTEALPRLRHASRKVDTEWYECKRLGAVQSDDIAEFEQWYLGKKATIRELDDKCKALCAASDIPPTGMGWTCPIKKGPM